MEKRRVTIWIGGQPCSFLSDDPDAYLSALEKRASAAMKQAAGNPLHAVVSLADQQLRAKQAEKPPKAEKAEKAEKPEKTEKPKKAEKPDPGKKTAMVEKGQVSVWDLINEKPPFSPE